jgi:hypothetical protein
MLEDFILLATGSGPEAQAGGWFFAIDQTADGKFSIEVLDHLMSSGLLMHEDKLHRVLCSSDDQWINGELISYDSRGVIGYRRVDGLYDPHGLAWDGTHFVIPCSAQNRIVWVTEAGAIAKDWKAPGAGDSWHVNGVAVHNGRLYASAFGRFDEAEAWRTDKTALSGIVFDVSSGATVISGLDCPHDPIFEGQSWLVCNSRPGAFLRIRDGVWENRIDLGGWTRGVAVAGASIFVGVSGKRYNDEQGNTASIAIIDRSTFSLKSIISLAPCVEVNSLCIVPRSLLAALRRGFRTNASRVAVQDRQELYNVVGNLQATTEWTPMHGLRNEECKTSIIATAPSSVRIGQKIEIDVKIQNLSEVVYFAAHPHPINLGSRWRNQDGSLAGFEMEERRQLLDRPLLPGATLSIKLQVNAPEVAGDFLLAVSLVQEWIAWFDEIDASNGCLIPITVLGTGKSATSFAQNLEAIKLFEEQLATLSSS